MNCGTCKHWEPVSDSSHVGPVPVDWVAVTAEEQEAAWKARNGDVGSCNAAVETWHVELDDEVPLLMVQDGSSYSAVMFTRKAFGCVLHDLQTRCRCGRRLLFLASGVPPVCVYCRKTDCTCEQLAE